MKSRGYTMRKRADDAAATRQRILDAAVQLLETRLRSDIRLDDVAGLAGVSVQTVLRVYGSREQLFEQAFEVVIAAIAAELTGAEPGDIPASVATWFDHYERVGDLVIRALAEEDDPMVQPIVRTGRAKHRERVEHQFGPQLAGRKDPALVDALVCACDVYTWKLLRRDMRRSRPAAEATMRRTVEALLGGE